jgi:hypothetical protein
MNAEIAACLDHVKAGNPSAIAVPILRSCGTGRAGIMYGLGMTRNPHTVLRDQLPMNRKVCQR